MLEVYGFNEALADHEIYGDRTCDPAAVKTAQRLAIAGTLSVGIHLSLQTPAEGRLMLPGVQVAQANGFAGNLLLNFFQESKPKSAPAIVENPSQVVLPEVTLETIDSIDITQFKFPHLSEGNWVLLTQSKLKWLGYDVQVDGHYGSTTKLAVLRFQYDIGLPADGFFGEDSKRALFNGEYPQTKATQDKPLGLWSPEEILSGVVPHNGRGRSTATYVNGWPIISHQYMRTIGSVTRPHRGADLPLKTGHQIYALGTQVSVWYDRGGGGLVIEQQHPNMPGVLIQNLHCNEAFGQSWSYYKSNGRKTFTVSVEELGTKVIGAVGSTGANGPGDYGEHTHVGLKLVSGEGFGVDRDDHDPRFLKVRTTLVHLLHWGVNEPVHVAEGQPAFSNHERRLDVSKIPSVVEVAALSGSSGVIAQEPPTPETSVSVASTAAPANVADVVQAITPTLGGDDLLDKLFEGGENSFMTIAIGSAEGTRRPDGSKTKYYREHTDPGNQVRNIGSFSFQHHGNAMSPAEADEAQLKRLLGQLDIVLADAEKMGLELSLEEVANLADLLNQSPWAGGVIASGSRSKAGGKGFVDHLYEAKTQLGKTGRAAIEHARVEAYKNSETGAFWADGLCYQGECNTWRAVHADQTRRMNEVEAAIKASQYSGGEIVLAGQSTVPEPEESGFTAKAPEAIEHEPPVGFLHGEERPEPTAEEAQQSVENEPKPNLLKKWFVQPTGESFKPKVDPAAIPKG
ncbi:MAG: peptidoglycan-binding protein [Tildeniella torsiva UHER 1998/13D]|nr:peptidoglycan-binding protein [Tildeniella torsiva UHER 1998/13D]